ncbi:MAG: hypothetical protein M1828_006091 [Chrysothrix sp. TS-e1954]|nr:MAG: hypothetical protein M1828_006091 [Chrysothrix sp. TS-e1954]
MPSFRLLTKVNRFMDIHFGGTRLEVIKFGMYILFPIGFMYYFGTNLDSRFSVPDFWPKPEMTHKIPYDREEIAEELQRLRKRRLEGRDRRLARERELKELGISRDERSEGEAVEGGT